MNRNEARKKIWEELKKVAKESDKIFPSNRCNHSLFSTHNVK